MNRDREALMLSNEAAYEQSSIPRPQDKPVANRGAPPEVLRYGRASEIVTHIINLNYQSIAAGHVDDKGSLLRRAYGSSSRWKALGR